MDFIVYDIVFLIIFCILTGIFLYKRRKNLKKEGIMYLYRTQLGIKFIEWFAKKNARWLRPLQYFVIAVGYALMGFVMYLMIQSVYIYIKYPIVSQVIRAPPIFPIFPYFNKFFGLSSFFPDLYFTYFI
ncbi:MAG: Loki-CTERM sorting domain-containing protein, partial [archaeon]